MTSSSADKSPDKQMTPREISEAWLEMHGADYGKEFTAKVTVPDLSGLVTDEWRHDAHSRDSFAHEP